MWMTYISTFSNQSENGVFETLLHLPRSHWVLFNIRCALLYAKVSRSKNIPWGRQSIKSCKGWIFTILLLKSRLLLKSLLFVQDIPCVEGYSQLVFQMYSVLDEEPISFCGATVYYK